MGKKILKVLYVFICLTIILVKEVHGYLDPSAMTYIVQIAITIGITIATSIGVFFYKIKKKLKKAKNNTVDEDE